MEVKLLKLAARLFMTRMRRGVEQRLRGKRPLAQVPSLKDKKLLFICGLHRSGTSILNRLLGEHPDVSGFAATGAAEDEGQHLQSVMPRDYAHGGHGVFAFDIAAHLTESAPLNTPANRDRLLREWCAYFDLSRQVLVEKSPPNIVRSRFLQALAPATRFVFIVRHPLAVALASRRSTGGSIPLLVAHWHIAHTIMCADLPHLRHAMVIRYEDMVAQSQDCLERICGLLGIAAFTPSETIVDHNTRYFAQWAQERKDYDALFDELYPQRGSLMASMGYSLKPPYVHEQVGAIEKFAVGAL